MANYTSDVYSFKIDGVSSDEYGVYVSTLEPVPHAVQRYTKGITRKPFALPDEVYDEIKYTIRFYKFYPENYDDSALRLYLMGGSVLQLSILPDVHFKILTIQSTVSQTADLKRFDYILTLTLEPYRYGVDNDWITIQSGDTVTNEGTIIAFPLIELTNPDGDITLTINGVNYTITGLEASESETPNKVYIDRTRFIIYNQDNELITGKDSGKLPELLVGDNVISWSGTVDAVRMRTNWREI